MNNTSGSFAKSGRMWYARIMHVTLLSRLDELKTDPPPYPSSLSPTTFPNIVGPYVLFLTCMAVSDIFNVSLLQNDVG